MKKPTTGKLVKKLDELFSLYIRQRGADDNGINKCFTCGVTKHWKEGDAGHFQTRAKYSTRWDELNVQFQCKHCNMTNGGQQYTFGKRLDEVYGEGTAESLLIKSNKIAKYSRQDLEELRIKYKNA